MPFGKRLKNARIAKKMTQEELAKAVGVTKGAIGNYESEVSSPKEQILIELMKILGIDANYLYQDYIESEDPFTPTEHRLVTAYRGAEPPIQTAALRMLEDSAQAQREKRGESEEERMA